MALRYAEQEEGTTKWKADKELLFSLMAESKAGSVRSAALERMRLMWRHLIRDVAYGMNVVCHLFTFVCFIQLFLLYVG